MIEREGHSEAIPGRKAARHESKRLGKRNSTDEMPRRSRRNEPYLTKRGQVSRRAAAGNRTKSYGGTG